MYSTISNIKSNSLAAFGNTIIFSNSPLPSIMIPVSEKWKLLQILHYFNMLTNMFLFEFALLQLWSEDIVVYVYEFL